MRNHIDRPFRKARARTPVSVIAAIFCGFIGLHDDARAQAVANQQKFALSGRPTRLGWLDKLDPECRPLPMNELAVVTPPRAGRVIFRRGPHHPNFPPTNIRARCNRLTTLATEIYYTSAPGFVGEDGFVVELLNSLGQQQFVRYRVLVR